MLMSHCWAVPKWWLLSSFFSMCWIWTIIVQLTHGWLSLKLTYFYWSNIFLTSNCLFLSALLFRGLLYGLEWFPRLYLYTSLRWQQLEMSCCRMNISGPLASIQFVCYILDWCPCITKIIRYWSYCMRLFYETSCLLSKSCSASAHFCLFLQKGFIFRFFSPDVEGLCKMLEWTCHCSESLIIGRQLFVFGKEQRVSVSNETAVASVQKSPGSRWLERTVLGEENDTSTSPSLQLTNSPRLDPRVVVPSSFHTPLS